MEKFQQGRPYPYVVHGAPSAPPPSYDQVYGGGYGPQMISHNPHQPCEQYQMPMCPPRPSGISNHYPPTTHLPFNIPTDVPTHNTSIANGIYYPDPRRIVTSSKLPSSNSSNNLIHVSNGPQSEEDDESKSVRCNNHISVMLSAETVFLSFWVFVFVYM